MVILLLIILLIISILGSNEMKIIGFTLMILYLHNENMEDSKYIFEREKKFYVSEFPRETVNMKHDADFSIMEKNLHTARQAEISSKNMVRSKVPSLRPLYEDDMNYYEEVDWWNI